MVVVVVSILCDLMTPAFDSPFCVPELDLPPAPQAPCPNCPVWYCATDSCERLVNVTAL